VDWKEEYKKRLVSAEDAVKAVKPGDYVVFAQPEAPALGLALVSLAGDISGVKIMAAAAAISPYMMRVGMTPFRMPSPWRHLCPALDPRPYRPEEVRLHRQRPLRRS